MMTSGDMTLREVLGNDVVDKLEADARALWAYRVHERAMLKASTMVDLAEHERRLIAHSEALVAADPSLDPDAPRGGS